MKKLLSLTVVLVLVFTLAGCSLTGERKVKDKHEMFELTLPKAMVFVDNEYAEDYDLAVYSKKEGIYVFGNSYTKEIEDLLAEVEKDKTQITDGRNVSETAEMTIANCKAYTYSYEYTDADITTDFYSQVVWIKTDRNIYILDLEVKLSNVEQYKTELNKIGESFVEI